MEGNSVEYLWIILVLAAQLAWAFENFIDKYLLEECREEGDGNDDSAIGKLFLVSCFFNVVVALVIFGWGHFFGNGESFNLSGINLAIALGVGVLEMIWLIPYLHALNRSDEISAPPIFQSVPVFGFLLGFFIFSEIPTTIHIVAGSLILFGSILLNLELAREKREEEGIAAAKVDWITILYMLSASIIVAIAAFLFKIPAVEGTYLATTFWMSIGSLLTGVVVWLCVPKYRREFGEFLRGSSTKVKVVNILNEASDGVATLAFYGAILLGPATALVQSTVAYQPLILLGIGVVAARYGSARHQHLSGSSLIRRGIGILIIVAGSLLIFL